jgi:molybdopterin adenylyltransferase
MKQMIFSSSVWYPSDRASTGVYQDQGIPALQEWLTNALTTPVRFETRLIPDEQARDRRR